MKIHFQLILVLFCLIPFVLCDEANAGKKFNEAIKNAKPTSPPSSN